MLTPKTYKILSVILIFFMTLPVYAKKKSSKKTETPAEDSGSMVKATFTPDEITEEEPVLLIDAEPVTLPETDNVLTIDDEAEPDAEETAHIDLLEQQRLEKEEQTRLELERQMEEEKARLEKERLEAEEKARLEAEEKAKQEEDIRKALEKMSTNQTPARIQKEYLQDFMKDDIAELPDDYVADKPSLIENPNEKDSNGQTLAMKAAKSGNEWQLKLLIESGADLNLKDRDGWTALMYAVRYQENTNTVNILINANADIKAKNNYDTSALLIAATHNNNPEILKKLLDYYSVSEKEVLKAFTQLVTAASIPEYVQIAKIKVFLKKSIQLNTFYEGKTPLMYAAQYGNSTQVLKLLLENGCITTVRSTEGKTAFEYASKNTKLKHDDYYWALNKK